MKRDMTIDTTTGLPMWLASKIRINPESGCWEWIGAISRGERCGGYGSVRWNGKSVQSHRVIWLHLRGPLSDELTLDHVKARGCTSIRCGNPDHLEPVTRGENNRRSTCHHHAAFRRNVGSARVRNRRAFGIFTAWVRLRARERFATTTTEIHTP